MSTTLKGVALGLAVPLVLTMSGWAGWTTLTSNLAPAESARTDQVGIEGVRDRQPPEVITAEPRAEPTPTPSADPPPEPSKGSDTVEPVQRPATAAKGGTEDAPASVTKSALTPVTAAQAEPVVPKKPKIRYVRVPKAATEPARN